MTTATVQQPRLPHASTALVALLLVSVFNYIDRTILSILQVPIKRDLGLSDAELGAVAGLAFALFFSAFSVPIARLADRVNRKALILVSLALWSAMTAASGWAIGFFSLLVFRIGVAIGEAGSVPASHTILSDYYHPDRRSVAVALWGLALPIGVMIGFLSGGWLAQAINWRVALFIVGSSGLLLVPVVALLLREPPRGSFEGSVAPQSLSWREALALLLKLPSFRWILVGGSLNNFLLTVMVSWAAPFYSRVHGLSLGTIATVLAFMTGIGGAVGILAGGWLSDRFARTSAGRRPLIVGGVLLGAAPAGLVQFLSGSVAVAIGAGALMVALMFFYYAPIIAMSHRLVPPSIRAFTSSIIMLALNLVGLGLGPWLTGMLSDRLAASGHAPGEALQWSLAIMSLTGLGAGAAFLLASRTYNRDMGAAQSGGR